MTDQLDIFDAATDDAGPKAELRLDTDLGRFRYDPDVAAHLLESGLSRGQLRLAADLVAMQPGLSDAESRALFITVVASLEAQSQGSTFVPLPSNSDYLSRRLGDLIPNSISQQDKDWATDSLIETLDGLLTRDDLRIVGRGEDFKPLVCDGNRLYHQRLKLYESRLADAVARRLNTEDIERDDQTLRAALDDVRKRQPPGKDGTPIELNAGQQYAMLTALHRPMTLITGGPGTGKTSIIVSILRMLVRLGISPRSIALAAPTGKAANRMAESIYDQLGKLETPADVDRRLADELDDPKTLHRLLSYSPRRDEFGHHRQNPLAQRMVIVDESSMIDLFLMERLLGAVSPGAQLVLLGDADQLPSVDTGAVLRDLIPDTLSTDAPWSQLVDGELPDEHGEAPTAHCAVRLQTSYRMRKDDPAGREILTFARQIRDYDADGEIPEPRRFDITDGDADLQGIQMWSPPTGGLDNSPQLDDFVDWWFDHMIMGDDYPTWKRRFNRSYEVDDSGRLTDDAQQQVRQLIDHYARARVLTLTRVFSTGSQRLNERFHRNTARLGDNRSEGDYDIHPGEPVMMLRNDYDRDLFNGDQGVVVWCEHTDRHGDRDVTLTAVFERTDRLISVPVAELRDDLEHAFAMTVHKAQGSEFEQVAMVLPAQPMALLNRELLYTGLTRASQAVLMVGRQQLVESGAANQHERFSAVAEKL